MSFRQIYKKLECLDRTENTMTKIVISIKQNNFTSQNVRASKTNKYANNHLNTHRLLHGIYGIRIISARDNHALGEIHGEHVTRVQWKKYNAS